MKLQISDNDPKEDQAIVNHFRSLGLAANCRNKGEAGVKLPGFEYYDFYIRYESISKNSGYYYAFIWEQCNGSIVAESAFDNLRDALSWAVLTTVLIDCKYARSIADHPFL